MATLLNLQAAYLANVKRIAEIEKAMKTSAEENSLLIQELEAERILLKKNKSKYNSRYKQDSKARTVYFASLVHRMVAENFIRKDSEDQTIVAHLDHDKLNNKISNLKWMTPAENVIHQRSSPNVIAEKEKRTKSSLNEGGRSKLSITKVMFLKKLLKEGKPIQNLAKQFKITETQVIRIKKEENWASVAAAE